MATANVRDMYRLLDSAKNQITDYKRTEILQSKAASLILNDVTHIIDCECYRLNAKISYREVSIFDVKKFTMFSIQCYDPSYPMDVKLSKKDRRTVTFQYHLHGLHFMNHQSCAKDYSQKEMKDYIATHYADNENVLFAYKGGDVERVLCRSLNIACVNLEHFNVEKYEQLLERFQLRSRNCKYHWLPLVHCSLYETILFAARLYELCNSNDIRDKLIQYYMDYNDYK